MDMYELIWKLLDLCWEADPQTFRNWIRKKRYEEADV